MAILKFSGLPFFSLYSCICCMRIPSIILFNYWICARPLFLLHRSALFLLSSLFLPICLVSIGQQTKTLSPMDAYNTLHIYLLLYVLYVISLFFFFNCKPLPHTSKPPSYKCTIVWIIALWFLLWRIGVFVYRLYI